MGLSVTPHISQIPKLSNFFTNTFPTLAFDGVGLTTLETLFYKTASQTTSKNKFVKGINELAIAHFHEIRFLFCVSNLASSLYFLDKKIFVVTGFYSKIVLVSLLVASGLAGSSISKKRSRLFYKFCNFAKCLASIRLLIEKNYLGFVSNCMGGIYSHYLNSKLENTQFLDLVAKATSKKDNQTLFEEFQVYYNLFHSALTSLQKYPEFKKSILNFQWYLLITDLISIAMSLHFLDKHICNVSTDSWEVRGKKSKIFWVSTVAIGLFSAAISYYINQYLKPSMNLQELLKDMDLPTEFKNLTTLEWNTPLTHLFIQTVCLSRFFATLVLTRYSSNNKANLMSLALLGYQYHGLSHLHWIRLRQKILDPVKKALALGGQCDWTIAPQNVAWLDWEADFLISSPCIKNEGHMKSIIQSISNYSQNLLKGSSWDCFWKITRSQGGGVLSEELIYNIKLVYQNALECSCSLLSEASGNFSGTIKEKFGRRYYDYLPFTDVGSVNFI